MLPGPTELRLIGCSIELTWIPKCNSNTSTPKTNLRTSRPKEVSHVMNGIICCACSVSAISVLQFSLKQHLPFQFCSLLCCDREETSTRLRRRTSHSKIATNDEPDCKGAIERINLDFDKLGDEKLWKSRSLVFKCWERESTGETGMITIRGLLKSGKLILKCAIDRGDPM